MNRANLAHWCLLVSWVAVALLGTWRLLVWQDRAQANQLALHQARQAMQATHELRRRIVSAGEWETSAATEDPVTRRLRGDLVKTVRQSWDRLVHNPALAGQPVGPAIARLLPSSAAPGPVAWRELDLLLNDLQGALLDELEAQSLAANTRQQAAWREAGLAFCLLIILGLLVINAVRVWLLSPLAALVTSAQQVSAGELDSRAPSVTGPAKPLAEAYNDMLEVLVDSLRQEQALRRALEDANRHKTQFLANVGHELKTPLSAIMGLAEILASGLHGAVNANQRDYLARITQAGDHLLDLIANLLDAARLELGRFRLQPSPFALPELLQTCQDWFTPALQDKGQTLTCEWPAAPLPELHQDRQRLRQIVLNLLSNASKFSPSGSHLSLRLAQQTDRFTLSLTDQGPGISPANQEQLFQPFVQLDGDLSRRQGGAGLGLALSRELARRLGGDLRLASSGPTGSVFVLDLPLHAPTSD